MQLIPITSDPILLFDLSTMLIVSIKRTVIHSGINAVKNIATLNNLFIEHLLFS